MQMPVTIQLVGLPASPALEAAIHTQVAECERLYPAAMAWRVTVEQEVQPANQGRPYAARVGVTLPGQELVATRVDDNDAYRAVVDAFDALKRRLEIGGRSGHAVPPPPAGEGVDE